MGLGIPPVTLKIILEPNPLKSMMLVGKLAVHPNYNKHTRVFAMMQACLGNALFQKSLRDPKTTLSEFASRKELLSTRRARDIGGFPCIRDFPVYGISLHKGFPCTREGPNPFCIPCDPAALDQRPREQRFKIHDIRFEYPNQQDYSGCCINFDHGLLQQPHPHDR